MTVAIQISDPHFGTEQAIVVDALLRLVRSQAPDLAIMSGDITQRALDTQFGAAHAFVQTLGMPTLVIPGNHDIPLYDMAARLLHPYANYSRRFGPELEPEFDSPDLLVITVNTTRWYRHTDGAVSAHQIARVAQRLKRAARSQLRIVVTHQPVCVIRPADEKNLLNGRRAAVREWARAGADLILGGHIHLPYVCPLHEQESQFGRLARPIWAVQAGTAVSSRIRHEAGNSVNLIRFSDDPATRRCTVERWDYLPPAQTFGVVAVHDLPLAPAHPDE